jgi:hypothetical protein
LTAGRHRVGIDPDEASLSEKQMVLLHQSASEAARSKRAAIVTGKFLGLSAHIAAGKRKLDHQRTEHKRAARSNTKKVPEVKRHLLASPVSSQQAQI